MFASRPSLASSGRVRVTNLRVTSEGPIAVLDTEVVHPLVRRALVVLTVAAADDEVWLTPQAIRAKMAERVAVLGSRPRVG